MYDYTLFISLIAAVLILFIPERKRKHNAAETNNNGTKRALPVVISGLQKRLTYILFVIVLATRLTFVFIYPKQLTLRVPVDSVPVLLQCSQMLFMVVYFAFLFVLLTYRHIECEYQWSYWQKVRKVLHVYIVLDVLITMALYLFTSSQHILEPAVALDLIRDPKITVNVFRFREITALIVLFALHTILFFRYLQVLKRWYAYALTTTFILFLAAIVYFMRLHLFYFFPLESLHSDGLQLFAMENGFLGQWFTLILFGTLIMQGLSLFQLNWEKHFISPQIRLNYATSLHSVSFLGLCCLLIIAIFPLLLELQFYW